MDAAFNAKFNPMLGKRKAPAWAALIETLGYTEWLSQRTAIDVMLEASDLQVKTCTVMLYQGVRAGHLERRGEWMGRGDDRREIRLVKR